MIEVNNNKFTQNYTKVYCNDEWKFNAPSHFIVNKLDENLNESHLMQIDFQEGPIKEYGINGISNEDAILMVITRLEAFQNSEYRCLENKEAIDSLYEAIDSLRKRTNKRVSRGVEGTSMV